MKLLILFLSISVPGVFQAMGKVFFTNVGFGNSCSMVNNCPDYSLMGVIKNTFAQLGYILEGVDAPSSIKYGNYLVSFNVPSKLHAFLQAHKKIAILWEPPVVYLGNYDLQILEQFDVVFTWNDDLVDNKKFFKFYGEQADLEMVPVVPFEKKKFCVLINNNKHSPHPRQLYGARREAIAFFECHHPHNFVLHGSGWETYKHPCYKGCIDNKLEHLKQYKFCICYENMRDVKGYITEKIFDCFKAGCVPIYWGASNVTDYIPSTCFVDRRDFKSYEDLYAFLSAMSPEKYEHYIKSIQKFLLSPQAHLFSREHFLTIFFQAIKPHPLAAMRFLSERGTDLKQSGSHRQPKCKQQMTSKMTYGLYQQKRGGNKWH